MLQILPRFPCKTPPPKQIARPQTLGRFFKNQLKHTGWQLASNYRKPKLLELAGKFPYMDHHGDVETSRWIGWNPAYLHIPIGKNLSPLLKVDDFFVIHIGKTPNQISRGKVWVQGTMPKISQVVQYVPMSLRWATKKNPALLSIIFWWVNRDSYFMVYYNPYTNG